MRRSAGTRTGKSLANARKRLRINRGNHWPWLLTSTIQKRKDRAVRDAEYNKEKAIQRRQGI